MPIGPNALFLIRSFTGLCRNAKAFYLPAAMKPIVLYLLLLLTGFFCSHAQELQATLQSNHVLLEWKLGQNRQADHCEVQRRARGGDFRTIALVLADNESDSAVYSYKDKLVGSESFLYYRIRTIYVNGDQQLSDIVPVAVFPGEQAPLRIVPTSPTAIAIELPEAGGTYLLRLYTKEGRLLATRRSAGGTCNWPLKKLKPGLYFMEAYLPVNGRRYFGSFRK